MHRLQVICRNFPRKFIKLSMETPYLCPSEGHKYGGRDVRETIWNLILLLGIVNTTTAPAVNLFFSAQFFSQSIISLDILGILFS